MHRAMSSDWCSTPFGINGRNTRHAGKLRQSGVLNAFRHQRKEHFQVSPVVAWSDVLNAFRHQRKEHVMARAADRRGNVLNAFRHQRKEHRHRPQIGHG